MASRAAYFFGSRTAEMPLLERLRALPWTVVLLLTAIAGVGVAMLYSAAGGDFEPWAIRHAIRYGVGLLALLFAALVHLRLWFRYAYLFYGAALLMLAAVEVLGVTGMGARRWLDFGFAAVQPSEVMKVTLVLALARYFHGVSSEQVGRVLYLLPPLAMIGVPVALILRQPDLGTAALVAVTGAAVLFLAGLRWWKIVAVAVAGLAAIPTAWQFLHDYQRQRVLIFLDPESDALGSGYHILQSKIALGSGGMLGRGFLQGTQSHLQFLPEKHTDFIFTMLAEEFGIVGSVALIGAYLLLLVYGYAISLRCPTQFGRLLGLGITTTFFLYLFINIAMVMGLIPVVGVPLPLVSYGGTAMLTVMFGFGLLLGVHMYRDANLGNPGEGAMR